MHDPDNEDLQRIEIDLIEQFNRECDRKVEEAKRKIAEGQVPLDAR